MNKKELVSKIAQEASLSKTTAEITLNATMAAISKALSEGETVKFIGFGTFAPQRRAARKGRNPTTGEEVAIPPRTVAKFTPGKKLSQMVQ